MNTELDLTKQNAVREGIMKDERLTALLIDASVAYVDHEGSILTSDKMAPVVNDISDALRNSMEAFGGKFFGRYPKVKLVEESEIVAKLNELRQTKPKEVLQKGKVDTSDAAKKLRRLLEDASARGASDIHIKNVIGERTEINIRVNGDFLVLRDQPPEFGENILTYIVMNLSGGSDYSIRGDADANFTMRIREVTKTEDGLEQPLERDTHWRLAQIPCAQGSKVTIRNLNASGDKPPEMETLGLAPGHISIIKKLMRTGEGLMLITGPTGSGKTTLINSALTEVPENKNIHTLEEPIEWQIAARNVTQTKVDESFIDPDGNKSQSFMANSIRLLRHDNNVIFYGEIRESEAASQIMRMSETGQFVVGTLHTNSAISSITTLAEQMDVSPAKLSAPGVLRALGHQRLVKALCDHCKLSHEEALELAPDHPRIAKSLEYNAQLGLDTENLRYMNPVGCEKCGGVGEPKRTAVFELVIIDRKCRDYIKEMDLNGLEDYLNTQKFPSIREHGIKKVVEGIVDVFSMEAKIDDLIPLDPKNIYSDMLG
ncbi:GspE/PulE family protein [Vibrio mediterranei]|uniref:GspE/PulE family protein n=1 Tax=Vibrio mediterranei TaxID=689 RepID=UPI00406973C4